MVSMPWIFHGHLLLTGCHLMGELPATARAILWQNLIVLCLSNMHNYEKDGHRFCGLAMFQYGLSPADWKHFPKATPSSDFKSIHAPPLFAHANLLKHSSGYLQGQTFTTVKRFKYDNVSEEMDRPRTNVYHSWQGMCVDLWDAFDDINPREHVEKDAEGKEIQPTFDNGDIITENSDEAFGGALKGFESM